MTKKQALTSLKKMSEEQFQQFFDTLPRRTKLLVGSGMVNWQEVLPEYYIELNK